MSKPFLTAHWNDLLSFTFAVNPRPLQPYLPPDLELDLLDGQALISLVGFRFRQTRIFGCTWPGYRDFPELNLRFYVQEGDRRGVIFIREFVPLHMVSWIARWFYNEHYITAPLRHELERQGDRLIARCRLTLGGQEHLLEIHAQAASVMTTEDSLDHRFKELHWGYNVDHQGRTRRYEVSHPPWRIFPVLQHRLQLDWRTVYGPEWQWLQDVQPLHVMLVEGSEVSVYPRQ